MNQGIPESFQSIRDIFVIHTYEMLKLDKKPPIYGVALLVAVACEVLAKMLPDEDGGNGEEIFARNFTDGRGAPRVVGRIIYEALRDGLAHSYDPQSIVVGGATVHLALSWKQGEHLRVVGMRRHEGHNHIVPVERNESPDRYVCVVVEALYQDMVALFDRTRERLLADPILAQTVADNVGRLQGRKQPLGAAREQWEAFLESAALHEEPGGQKQEGSGDGQTR